MELALKDIERFKRQKVKDLKDVFTNYAILQIERCKKASIISEIKLKFKVNKSSMLL